MMTQNVPARQVSGRASTGRSGAAVGRAAGASEGDGGSGHVQAGTGGGGRALRAAMGSILEKGKGTSRRVGRSRRRSGDWNQEQGRFWF